MEENNKKKTGLIIGICAGVVVIAAVVVLLLVFVFNSKDGTYTASQNFYGQKVTLTIKVNGSKGTFTYKIGDEGETQKFKAKWKGDTLQMEVDGDVSEVKYDKKNKTLTIDGDDFLGEDIVLKKK